MSRKLYVGNLPTRPGDRVQELFARGAPSKTVKVMRDMAQGRARGFAFVEMSTARRRRKPITELNEYQLGRGRSRINEGASQAAHAAEDSAVAAGGTRVVATEPRW